MIARRGERDRRGRAHDRVGIGPQPAEQLGRLICVAVARRQAGGDPDGGGAFGRIRRTEQAVRQGRRGSAVSGAGERVGDPRPQRLRARVDRRPIQPRGPRRVAPRRPCLLGKDGRQLVVLHAVLGEQEREIR